MTAATRPTPTPATPLTITDRYIDPRPGYRCEQVMSSATVEESAWVTYNPAEIERLALLRGNDNPMRFRLGCAGYIHYLTVGACEVWARPTHTRVSP